MFNSPFFCFLLLIFSVSSSDGRSVRFYDNDSMNKKTCRKVPGIDDIWYMVSSFQNRKYIYGEYQDTHPLTVEVVYYNNEECNDMNYGRLDNPFEIARVIFTSACSVLHRHLCNQTAILYDDNYVCDVVEYVKVYESCEGFEVSMLFDEENDGPYKIIFSVLGTSVVVFFVIVCVVLGILLSYVFRKYRMVKKKEGPKNTHGEEMFVSKLSELEFEGMNVDTKIINVVISIIIVFAFEFKDLFALWISIICLNVPVEEDGDQYIGLNQANEMINFFIVSGLVFFVVFETVMVIIFAWKYFTSPFKLVIALMCFKENFIFRFFSAAFYLAFFLMGIIIMVVHEYYIGYMSGLFMKGRQNFNAFYIAMLHVFQFLLSEFILVNKVLSIFAYDSPVSITYLKKFEMIKKFPDIKIRLFKALFSNNEDFVTELLHMLSIIEKKEDVKERKLSLDFTHLRWVFMMDLSDVEIRFLKIFFYDFDSKFQPSQRFWDVFFYVSPFAPIWRENLKDPLLINDYKGEMQDIKKPDVGRPDEQALIVQQVDQKQTSAPPQ